MADMVPYEIEPAEGVGGAPRDASGEIVLAQIADEPERPAARGGDLADDCIDTCLIDVDDAHCRAFSGKSGRPGSAHPRGRCRHDPNLIFESHDPTPIQWRSAVTLQRPLLARQHGAVATAAPAAHLQ